MNNEDNGDTQDGDLTDEQIERLDTLYVEETLNKLMCRFDAVQIFVTRQEPDGRTMGYATGKGNFYSRVGVVNEWVSRGGVDDSPPDITEDEQE